MIQITMLDNKDVTWRITKQDDMNVASARLLLCMWQNVHEAQSLCLQADDVTSMSSAVCAGRIVSQLAFL